MSNERKYNTFYLPYNKYKRKRTKIASIEIVNPTLDTFISKSTILPHLIKHHWFVFNAK